MARSCRSGMRETCVSTPFNGKDVKNAAATAAAAAAAAAATGRRAPHALKTLSEHLARYGCRHKITPVPHLQILRKPET